MNTTAPIIGDRIRGDKIGKSKEDYFTWAQCPVCKKERWLPNHDLDKRVVYGRCRQCNLKTRRGTNSPNWKGGRLCRKNNGYVMVAISPDDPFYGMGKSYGRSAYVQEHRYVMAKNIGRCLESWEVVHHKNGVRNDNRIENLSLMTNSGHVQIEKQTRRIRQLEQRVTQLEAELALYHLESSPT